MGGQNDVDAGSTSFLRQTYDRTGNAASGGLGFRTAAARHGKVGILIHNYYQIRQEAMSLVTAKVMLTEFLVVQGDLVDSGLGQQFVTIVHLNAHGTQNLFSILRLLDDGGVHFIFFGCRIGHDSQIVVQKFGVGREFHHLRVDEYELKLRRMSAVQQRTHYYVEAHRLALLCSAGHEEVGRVGQVEYLDLLSDSITDGDRQFRLALAEGFIIEKGLERYYRSKVIGNFNTDGIFQCHHAYSLGPQRHGNIFLELLDVGDLDSRGGIDFVQRDRRTYDGRHVVDLYLVVGESSTYLVAVAYEFLCRDLVAVAVVGFEQFQRWREIKLGQPVWRVQTVVDRLELFLDIGVKAFAVVGFDGIVGIRLLFYAGLDINCGPGLGPWFGLRLRFRLIDGLWFGLRFRFRFGFRFPHALPLSEAGQPAVEAA